MKIRVYYEDTDAGGIVYHANYIKYCERARSELFFEKNMIPTEGDTSSFVVRCIDANFLGMAYLGELLEVTTEFVHQKNSSCVLKQSIFNKEVKVFEMEVLLVFLRDGKPARIPQHLIEVFVSKKV